MTTETMETARDERDEQDDVHGFAPPLFFWLMVAAGAGAGTGVVLSGEITFGTLGGPLHR